MGAEVSLRTSAAYAVAACGLMGSVTSTPPGSTTNIDWYPAYSKMYTPSPTGLTTARGPAT